MTSSNHPMNKTLHPRSSQFSVPCLIAMVALLTLGSANAALLFSWKQTGSDVTATLTGTLDAAWGTPFLDDRELEYATEGGFGSAFTGFGFGPYLQYGSTAGSGHDVYYIGSYTASPSISTIDGFLVEDGGVVQAGSSPLVLLEVNSSSFPYIWLEVLPGTTTIDATVVWSDKLLADFFTSGDPTSSEIFNSSNELLMTLEIGEFAPEPIPEPGTWAAAALLVGGAAFARWRRRRAVKQAAVV
jgi:hypothetical protein